jgi:hypothetical protein
MWGPNILSSFMDQGLRSTGQKEICLHHSRRVPHLSCFSAHWIAGMPINMGAVLANLDHLQALFVESMGAGEYQNWGCKQHPAQGAGQHHTQHLHSHQLYTGTLDFWNCHGIPLLEPGHNRSMARLSSGWKKSGSQDMSGSQCPNPVHHSFLYSSGARHCSCIFKRL